MTDKESKHTDEEVIYYYFKGNLKKIEIVDFGKITFNFQNGKITHIEKTETIK